MSSSPPRGRSSRIRSSGNSSASCAVTSTATKLAAAGGAFRSAAWLACVVAADLCLDFALSAACLAEACSGGFCSAASNAAGGVSPGTTNGVPQRGQRTFRPMYEASTFSRFEHCEQWNRITRWPTSLRLYFWIYCWMFKELDQVLTQCTVLPGFCWAPRQFAGRDLISPLHKRQCAAKSLPRVRLLAKRGVLRGSALRVQSSAAHGPDRSGALAQ